MIQFSIEKSCRKNRKFGKFYFVFAPNFRSHFQHLYQNAVGTRQATHPTHLVSGISFEKQVVSLMKSTKCLPGACRANVLANDLKAFEIAQYFLPDKVKKSEFSNLEKNSG